MIECILTDPLFYAVAIAGAVIGCALGVTAMCIVSINRYNDLEFKTPPGGSKLIICTKEELNDPEFLERIHKANDHERIQHN